MNERESFSDLICEKQARMAERELSSFSSAVTELYGPAEARRSEKDWLEESESRIAPRYRPGELGVLWRLLRQLDWQVVCRSFWIGRTRLSRIDTKVWPIPS